MTSSSGDADVNAGGKVAPTITGRQPGGGGPEPKNHHGGGKRPTFTVDGEWRDSAD